MSIATIGQFDPIISSMNDLNSTSRRQSKVSSAGAPSFADELAKTGEGRLADPSAAKNPVNMIAKLESLLLQQAISSILPQKSQVNWGSGLAGDVWRSMLSEQLANTMTRDGRVPLLTGVSNATIGVGRPGDGAGS